MREDDDDSLPAAAVRRGRPLGPPGLFHPVKLAPPRHARIGLRRAWRASSFLDIAGQQGRQLLDDVREAIDYILPLADVVG